MPMEFDGSDDLFTDTLTITAPPFTFACFMTFDFVTSNDALWGLSDVSGDAQHMLHINFPSNGDITCSSKISGFANSTIGGHSVDTEYHVAGVWTTTTLRTVYVDGVAGTSNTTSKVPTNLDRMSWGSIYFGSARRIPLEGTLAEAAVWNAALTDAEVAALAQGVSPLLIRPSALVNYPPFRLDDRDLMGGTLTSSGDPAIVSGHPNIIMPSAQILQFPPVAGGPAPEEFLGRNYPQGAMRGVMRGVV